MKSVSRAVALALLSTAATSVLCAQQAPLTAAAPDASDSIDELVVLGTALSNTTELTSTAPVTVVSAQALSDTGARTLNEALAALDPSFNFPQGQNAVKGQGVRSASLESVSPAYTLILVNGKRRNASSLLAGTDPWPAATVVDIDTIPLSAIDHVEILTDGAAAQYGSDAIAGVINIVLKSSGSGTEVGVALGGYTDGGGLSRHISAFQGAALGDGGFINFSVERLKTDLVDRSAPDWRQLFPNQDPRNTSYPKDYGDWGQSARNNWTGLINAELPLGTDWKAYGWLNYANKSSFDYVNPERVVAANTASVTATTGTQLSPTDVLSVYPNGYQPAMQYNMIDKAVVGGLKYGNEGIGNFDFGLSWGQSLTSRNTYNTINPSWGASSPTSFYLGSWVSNATSATLDYTKTLPISWVNSAVLSAGILYRNEKWGTDSVGDYIGYTNGPLGGETVAQAYGVGGVYSQFASQFPGVAFPTDKGVIPATGSSTAGITPTDQGTVQRNVKGGYVGLDGKITDQLSVGVTGREEDYSDFGRTSNYRLTGRYEFIPAVALRGTLSSGFHAPSLAEIGQQVTGYTSTFTNNGTSILAPGETLQFRPSDPAAALFGAKPLQPEKSTTASLGLVLRPDSTSSVTIDAYRLSIKNVITITDALQGAAVNKAFAAQAYVGYTQATYYRNAWDQRTDGVDIAGHKKWLLPVGTLDINASAAFHYTTVTNFHNTVQIEGTSVTALSNSHLRDQVDGVSRNKDVLEARYSHGPWSYSITGTRFSSYWYNAGNTPLVAASNGNIDQEFAPEIYWDLGVSYLTESNVRVDLKILNAFDRYPDQYVDGNRASGLNPYSFIAPNGASGRFIEVGATYKF